MTITYGYLSSEALATGGQIQKAKMNRASVNNIHSGSSHRYRYSVANPRYDFALPSYRP